jgi:hypothetical protein
MTSKVAVAEIWKVGRSNWRYFAFAWLIPIVLYLTFVAESVFGPIHSKYVVWILLGELVALVLAGVVSSAPYRRRQVTLGQMFFWILLVPLSLLVLLSLLPFGFPVTITGIPIGSNDWMKP